MLTIRWFFLLPGISKWFLSLVFNPSFVFVASHCSRGKKSYLCTHSQQPWSHSGILSFWRLPSCCKSKKTTDKSAIAFCHCHKWRVQFVVAVNCIWHLPIPSGWFKAQRQTVVYEKAEDSMKGIASHGTNGHTHMKDFWRATKIIDSERIVGWGKKSEPVHNKQWACTPCTTL